MAPEREENKAKVLKHREGEDSQPDQKSQTLKSRYLLPTEEKLGSRGGLLPTPHQNFLHN